MQVLNAIYLHQKDNHLIDRHLESLRRVLGTTQIVGNLFYGSDQEPVEKYSQVSVKLGCKDTRDNMSLKTYGLMKWALEYAPCWSHIFKTDVTVELLEVDWGKVEESDHAGCVITLSDYQMGNSLNRVYKNHEREPLLTEPWLGILPRQWCSGGAYFVSRRLAEAIVAEGAWKARGHFSEDTMVGGIAERCGFPLVPAVKFRDEQGVRGPTFP